MAMAARVDGGLGEALTKRRRWQWLRRGEGDLLVGVAFEKELEALFGVDGGVEQGRRVLTGAFQLDEVVEISVVEISVEEGDDDLSRRGSWRRSLFAGCEMMRIRTSIGDLEVGGSPVLRRSVPKGVVGVRDSALLE